MENKVLEENISHIARYNKRLSDEILRFNCEKSTLELVQMPNNEFNLFTNGSFIHDMNGAQDEAKRIVNSIKNKDEKNIVRIIYGLGLGYLVDEAAKNLQGKIIVYEPDLNLIKTVLSLAKIDGLYKNNVFLCSDKDVLSEYAYALTDENSNISITFLNYHKKFLDDIKDVLYTAQKAQARHRGDKGTLYKKIPMALYNSCINLEKILKTPNILDLKDIYKGKTAICLSAGPSLAENIEIIKKNQDKFVIFALNPTIKLLAKHDIQPDFILYIETINNIAQFQYDIVKNSYLILEPYCYWKTYTLQSKGIFNYISENTFLNPWVLDCLKSKTNLQTMGTVSYMALMSAFIMGFEKIILIGQDLAYKDGNCYAKGSHYENLKCVFKKELNKYVIEPDNIEEFEKAVKLSAKDTQIMKLNAKRYLEFLNNNIATIKAQDGSLLPTQTGYAIFVDIFRKLAKDLKEIKPTLKLINSSIGGAQIDNFENLELYEVVRNLNSIEKPDLKLKQPVLDKNHIKNNIQKMKNNLLALKDFVLEVREITSKLCDELNIKSEINQKVINLLKEQSLIFKKIEFLPKDKYFNIVVESFENRISSYFDENYLKSPESCFKANSDALKAVDWLIEVLNKSIKKLTDCELFVLQ